MSRDSSILSLLSDAELANLGFARHAAEQTLVVHVQEPWAFTSWPKMSFDRFYWTDRPWIKIAGVEDSLTPQCDFAISVGETGILSLTVGGKSLEDGSDRAFLMAREIRFREWWEQLVRVRAVLPSVKKLDELFIERLVAFFRKCQTHSSTEKRVCEGEWPFRVYCEACMFAFAEYRASLKEDEFLPEIHPYLYVPREDATYHNSFFGLLAKLYLQAALKRLPIVVPEAKRRFATQMRAFSDALLDQTASAPAYDQPKA